MAEKKNPEGRPTKYSPHYCKMIIDHFRNSPLFKVTTKQYIDKYGNEKVKKLKEVAEFPTIEDFADSIDVCHDTLIEWATKVDKEGNLVHPEFSEAYKKAKELQKNIWQKNSMLGRYNPAFTIFAGKNLFGWTDKQEIDHTSKGEKLEIGLVTYTPPDAKADHSS